MDFLKIVEENSEKYCNQMLFSDGTDSLTYGEAYEFSGRVYAYLKNKGIGKEDFVLIRLKRGPLPLAAMIGILRVGAAFILLEDDMPAERIALIQADCGSRLVLDEACKAELLATEPLSGFEVRDAHSAAFAVYTSGTTGKPKGVLHEYGNIDRILRSNPFRYKKDRLALICPLNFIASLMYGLPIIAAAQQCYVVPLTTAKDPEKFHSFLLEHQITIAFLAPTYIKKMAPLIKTLKICPTGTEVVADLYIEGPVLVNVYAMSETGFVVAAFSIDRPYANTPVGKSPCDFPIYLMDEAGKEVEEGEKGEIVLENPYVRGYINLPEKNAKAFRGGLYHTGDLGRWNETHDLVICGRLDDMEKVNGNRVEPAEIEAVARQVLSLSWAAARVFHNEGSPLISLYYTDQVTIDPEEAKKKMAEKLPYYMIPQFFQHIDQIPLTVTGKFDRKSLPAPDLSCGRMPYREPGNAAESAVCKAFEKVFHVDRAGLDDDFLRLGGDSMNAMEIVMEADLEGLMVVDVLSGRTPEGIAAHYQAREKKENIDEINEAALKKDFPLTPNQAYSVNWQLKEPDSIMRSIQKLVKLDKTGLDMDKVAEAVSKAVRNHPAFMTEIYYGEDGQLRQRFNPDLLNDIRVERLTDEELVKVKSTLAKPFTMIQVPLIRVRVFETETAGYVFLDVHHTVFDGTSHDILLSDIRSAYSGKELPKDYYPYILEKMSEQEGSVAYEENKAYFEQKYGKKNWCRQLPVIAKADNSVVGVIDKKFPVKLSQLVKAAKSKGISKNGFFAIAAAEAIAKCGGTPDVMIFWTFHGRTNVKEMHSVGNLRLSLPIALSFAGDVSPEAVYADVSEQVSGGMAHCRYPYLDMHPEYLDDGVTRLYYQASVEKTPDIPRMIETDAFIRTYRVSRTYMNIEIREMGEDVLLSLKYTEQTYDPKVVDQFVKLFLEAVKHRCS